MLNCKEIYSMLKYYIKNIIIKLTGPTIIRGYKRYDNIFLKNTRIGNTTVIGPKDKFNIGDNVYIGHYNFIEASNGITIEEGCQLTNYISLVTHSSHISIRLYGKNYIDAIDLTGYKKGNIYIGKYCFIGPYCTIMPNTNIGKGSIVKAYSYVKGKYPENSGYFSVM
jgi:acetyltransferase-like isoleucine patch superfamily enzyme